MSMSVRLPMAAPHALTVVNIAVHQRAFRENVGRLRELLRSHKADPSPFHFSFFSSTSGRKRRGPRATAAGRPAESDRERRDSRSASAGRPADPDSERRGSRSASAGRAAERKFIKEHKYEP